MTHFSLLSDKRLSITLIALSIVALVTPLIANAEYCAMAVGQTDTGQYSYCARYGFQTQEQANQAAGQCLESRGNIPRPTIRVNTQLDGVIAVVFFNRRDGSQGYELLQQRNAVLDTLFYAMIVLPLFDIVTGASSDTFLSSCWIQA